MNTQQGMSKYIRIIITFILLGCIVATLFANIYIANKANVTSLLITKTIEQKMLIQRISKALIRAQTQRRAKRDYRLDISELAYSYSQFNNTLYDLSKGGTIRDNNNKKIKIDKLTNESVTDIFKKSILLWSKIKLSLAELDSPTNFLPDTKLQAISDIVNSYNVKMMALIDEQTVFYKQQHNQYSQWLYISYLSGIIFIVVLILFLFFKPKTISIKDNENDTENQLDLKQFLANIETELKTINLSIQLFETYEQDVSELKKIIDPINNIKESSSAIGCASIENIAHDLLAGIKLLQATETKLTESNFALISHKLEQLNNNFTLFSELTNKENTAQEIEQAKNDTPTSPQYDDWLQLKTLATTLAQEQDKKTELHLHGLQTELPKDYHKGLINISEQLIRNSITHGIETAEQRQTACKPEYGQITITLNPTKDEGYEYIYEDDGQGINYEEIRKAVVAQGFANLTTANKMDKNQLAAYIFKLGFSTSRNNAVGSGGGIGMDIVKHIIDKLGGKTIVLSVVNKNTRFTVILPPVGTKKEQLASSSTNNDPVALRVINNN